MFTEHNKGIYFAFITAIVSGVSIFVNKYAVGIVSPPLLFTTLKNLLVAIALLLFVLSAKKLKKVLTLNRKELFYLILIGIVGGSIPFYLYFVGLSMIPAINSALIHKTLVFWVALLAIPFLKEKISKIELVAIFILFGSNLFIGGFKGLQFSYGELLTLGATLFWAVENILAKKVLKSVDYDLVSLFRMGIGSFILLAMTLKTSSAGVANIVSLSSVQWGLILLTVLLLMLYVSSWYRALQFAPAVTVTSILVSSTLVTNLLSAIFITKVWTVPLTLQSFFIMVAIAMILLGKNKNFVPVQS